ncbi:hypothetical protein F5B19DRAFT_345752 [Rostrohypoxylon terebratum]|nr:hypothetical protein F5B19DRAFT_345752 [Rostrohypoxylon terebratum]
MISSIKDIFLLISFTQISSRQEKDRTFRFQPKQTASHFIMHLSGINPTRPITCVLLIQVCGVLSWPMFNTTYYPTLASSIEPRNVTQDGNINEGSQDTNSLTWVETIATALGLGLAVITTIIAIIECRKRSKNRTSSHERRITGEPRNPVNDEPGREAVDALALQSEDMISSNGTPLLIIPPPAALFTSRATIQAIPPKPMPAERPSRGQGHATPPYGRFTVSMDGDHAPLPVKAATLAHYGGCVSLEARPMS